MEEPKSRKAQLWRERLKGAQRNSPSLPFYKRALFQTVAALVPVIIGLTVIWDKLAPTDEPSGHYIEILIEASENMLMIERDQKTKWDSVLLAVEEHFAQDLHSSDHIALRTFGGSCSGEDSTKKLLDFSTDARQKAISKLGKVSPKGKPTFEVGIISATSDFKDLEQAPNVYRRIIAIVGSSSFCSSNRISEIAANRLGDKYNFDIVVIGFGLSGDQIKPLKEFSESEFVSNVLFVDSQESLLKAMDWATDIGSSQSASNFVDFEIKEYAQRDGGILPTTPKSQETPQNDKPEKEQPDVQKSLCIHDDTEFDTSTPSGVETQTPYALNLEQYSKRMCGVNSNNSNCKLFSVVEDSNLYGIHAFKDSIRFNHNNMTQYGEDIQIGLLAHEVAHFVYPQNILTLPFNLYPNEVSTLNGVPITSEIASYIYTQPGQFQYWQSYESRYHETMEYIFTGCNLGRIAFSKDQFETARDHLVNYEPLLEKAKAVREQSLNLGFSWCSVPN
ncbi:hypothetical protein [Arenicella xantha]|uniref:VWFA domain-containing protein n=1 Tax=Arenicella xantha TaxID=644221 RepID=A0A395JPT8_9GAMM|nr:hypothetical protein [Arenicella xantha]RBP53517.1 hypothetical protein DFR28_101904 [Arenicella xantha]